MSEDQPRPVRDRILQTSLELFGRDGFRAVGIDTIIAEADVAKMSLYRHFPSKDDLIVACLDEATRYFWDWLDLEVGDVEDPLDRLVAIVQAMEKHKTTDSAGCSAQGTGVEFPDHDSAVHKAAVAHNRDARDRFTRLAAKGKARDPEQLANQLMLLIDGAWVANRLLGSRIGSSGLAEAAATLVDSHRPGSPQSADGP